MIKAPLPVDVTRDLFFKWRAAVRGTVNPHAMANPVWKWLVESRLSAYQANELFLGDAGTGPRWCFDRFGQSHTELPDGRTVWIAGEHEDYYDPDFFIYNDVTVVAPSGEIEIFGYPPEVFPPTDFHSASLIDERIVIIGSLGYGNQRRAAATQVLTLEIDRWHVSNIPSKGVGPGWIHDHQARVTDNGHAIVISGGKVDRCDGTSTVENIDDWQLNIGEWRWERLTARRWSRFEVHRQDKRQNHLWSMRQTLWSEQVGWDDAKEWKQRLQAELGSVPRLDIVPTLYRPNIPHETIPENDDEYGVHRIQIDAVIVRYVEDSFCIQVTAEGSLPSEVIEQLRNDLVAKLEALERAPIVYRTIPSA